MPRNAAGVYTLPVGNPVITGTTIQSSWANTTMPDLGNEVTNSLDRSGRGSMLAPLKLVDGSQALPGMTFSAEPSSGWFRSGAGVLGLSVLNTLVMTATATGVTWALALGSAAAPSISFSGDSNTGIYSPGADIVGITAAGAEVSRWSAAQQSNVLGSAAAPSYAFTGDLNTGIYSPGADQLAISVNGAIRLSVDTAAVTSFQPYVAPIGAVGAPAYTFTGDLNTGVYSAGADQLNFATGGVLRQSIGSTGQHVFAAPTTGVAVTVNTLVSNYGISITGDLGGQAGLLINTVNGGNGRAVIEFTRAAGTPKTWFIGNDSDGGTDNSFDIRDVTRGVIPFSISTTGNITAAAPTAGSTFVAAGVDSANVMRFSGTTKGTRFGFTAGASIIEGVDSTGVGSFQPLQVGGSTLTLTISNTAAISINAARNVTIDAPSSGNTLTLSQVAGSLALNQSQSLNATTASWNLSNTSNTASSDARMQVQVGGSSGGDPFAVFTISGAINWSVGPDNSDSDVFKISASANPSGGSNWLNINADGRVYGTALHNNAGAVTGTTNQYIASGTWTPTLTAGINLGASTVQQGQWVRIGNVVNCSFVVTQACTVNNTISGFEFSLPIPSNFINTGELSGSAGRRDAAGSGSGTVIASVANDTGVVSWFFTTLGSNIMSINATYVIL